jgi:PEGA domain
MMKIQVRGSEIKQFLALWIALLAMLSIANGAEVVLTSDPPGAVISVAGKEVGMTPLTLSLPAGQPVEVSSRFGPLGVLVHTLTPDESQVIAYQFKHEYGTIVVTCDRTDAALVIDGTGYGHPPAVVLVSPGQHKLFLTASNAPDKTQEVEVGAGQRASVEMDFSGGSPETTKASVSPQSSPEDSASPAPKASPSPQGHGPKPSPAERTRVVWEEPPPLIPAAEEPAKATPSAAPLPKRKPVTKREEKMSARVALVTENGNPEKKKANPSPSPAVSLDQAKARVQLESRRRVKEEELKLEKEQIEARIKNSTGAVREQWKYRLAVWEEKMKTAKQTELAAEAALR